MRIFNAGWHTTPRAYRQADSRRGPRRRVNSSQPCGSPVQGADAGARLESPSRRVCFAAPAGLDWPSRPAYGRRRHPSEGSSTWDSRRRRRWWCTRVPLQCLRAAVPGTPDYRQIAAETLGRRRRAVRRELRDLSGLVRPPERAVHDGQGMVGPAWGLVVATEAQFKATPQRSQRHG
jgi:hypothetical protein